jgi:hypothetical protein
MGEIGDLLYEAMDDMYQNLIEEGRSPAEARQRVDEVDWATYNPFEIYAAEYAFCDFVERREYTAYLRSQEWHERVALV